MRLDPDLQQHAAVSVRVGREILQPDRGLAAMVNLGIHETDLSWLIVEIESCEKLVLQSPGV